MGLVHNTGKVIHSQSSVSDNGGGAEWDNFHKHSLLFSKNHEERLLIQHCHHSNHVHAVWSNIVWNVFNWFAKWENWNRVNFGASLCSRRSSYCVHVYHNFIKNFIGNNFCLSIFSSKKRISWEKWKKLAFGRRSDPLSRSTSNEPISKEKPLIAIFPTNFPHLIGLK